jgi:hypothetical protein
MPVSPILEIPMLTETMAQKTIAVNMALQSMEQAIAGFLSIPTTTGFFPTFEIPFDDTNDLSPREALRAIYYVIEPGADSEFYLHHPPNPHMFVIKNGTTQQCNLRVAGGPILVLPASVVYLVYCDGVNMIKMDFSLINLTQVNDYDVYFHGAPLAGQVLGRFLVGRDVTFPANLAGAIAKCDVNPLTFWDVGLWANSTNFATLTIASDGDVSGSTTGGAPFTCSIGTVLEFRGPSPADPLVSDIMMYVRATCVVAQPVPT